MMKLVKKSYLSAALALSTCAVLFQNCAAAPPPDLDQINGGTFSSTSPQGTVVAPPGATATATPTPTVVAPVVTPLKACNVGPFSLPHGDSVTAYQSASVAAGGTCQSQTRTCNDGNLNGSYMYVNCYVETPAANASCSFDGRTIIHGGTTTAFATSSVPYGSTCASEVRQCSNGTLSGNYNYGSCAPLPAPTYASCEFNGEIIPHTGTVIAFNRYCATQTRTCSNGVLSGTYAFSECPNLDTYPKYPSDGTQIQ